jgi:hypothetical protein
MRNGRVLILFGILPLLTIILGFAAFTFSDSTRYLLAVGAVVSVVPVLILLGFSMNSRAVIVIGILLLLASSIGFAVSGFSGVTSFWVTLLSLQCIVIFVISMTAFITSLNGRVLILFGILSLLASAIVFAVFAFSFTTRSWLRILGAIGVVAVGGGLLLGTLAVPPHYKLALLSPVLLALLGLVAWGVYVWVPVYALLPVTIVLLGDLIILAVVSDRYPTVRYLLNFVLVVGVGVAATASVLNSWLNLSTALAAATWGLLLMTLMLLEVNTRRMAGGFLTGGMLALLTSWVNARANGADLLLLHLLMAMTAAATIAQVIVLVRYAGIAVRAAYKKHAQQQQNTSSSTRRRRVLRRRKRLAQVVEHWPYGALAALVLSTALAQQVDWAWLRLSTAIGIAGFVGAGVAIGAQMIFGWFTRRFEWGAVGDVSQHPGND